MAYYTYYKEIHTDSFKAPAWQYKLLTEGKLKNKDTVSYVFKASSNYYILLNTKKDSKEFEFKIEIRDDTVKLSSLIDDLTYVYKDRYNSMPERIVNHIKHNIKTQKKILGEYIVKDQNISFLFNYYDPPGQILTDNHKSKLTINNNNSIQIFLSYVNLLIVSYDHSFVESSNRLKAKPIISSFYKKNKGSNYSDKEDFRDDIRDVIIWSQGPYGKKGGKKNNSKKSKDEKMSGGENGEISKTFKRKSPGMGITPYDLTISSEPNAIINLEIKITSSFLPFKTFKESFSESLKPRKNTNNAVTIHRIKELFDQKIKKTTSLGKEFVVNGQTILFKFNLASEKSTVTIGDKSISINTTFMGVLFSIYSNNKLSLLNKPSNGKPFKNVLINISDKIGKEQTNKTKKLTNQQNNKPTNQINQINQPTNKTNQPTNQPIKQPIEPYKVPYNIR